MITPRASGCVANEEKYVVTFHAGPSSPGRFEMDFYDHQDAFTRSYGDNVVTPLTCDLVRDKRMVWQEVFMDKNPTRQHPRCLV